MKRIKLVAALAVLTLVFVACTEAADTTTTGGGEAPATTEGGEAPATTQVPGTTVPSGPAAGETLAEVQSRGTLNCGVNDAVPGFGFVDESGAFSGFDIDYCRALAAAVLGDPEAVTYTPLTAETRLTALQSGEIDVLIRNTTFTATRDGENGLTFLTTTFYDGQGMMVAADSGFTSIDDMTDTNICVLSGTTTELNLAVRMADITHTPVVFDENEQIQAAFLAGQCDGWTSDKSQLSGVRSAWPEDQGGPDALVILEETFSKEPLGPLVRDGDSQWAQIVDWVVIVTIQAEESGITSENVGTFADTEDAEIRRLLGLEITDDAGNVSIFDPGLGLEPGFAAAVIEAVGNYGEIYERNVGSATPLGLERGVNALWTDGGLIYAPPYR